MNPSPGAFGLGLAFCSTFALGSMLAASGCADTPQVKDTTPAIRMPNGVEASKVIACPRGTQLTVGQVMGVPSVVWCELPDGKRQGPFLEWWPNQKQKAAGEYRNGLRQGVWTFWREGGEPDSQIEYRDGVSLSGPSPAPDPATNPAVAPPAPPAPAAPRP